LVSEWQLLCLLGEIICQLYFLTVSFFLSTVSQSLQSLVNWSPN
jgi:hypothetical protein